MPDLWRLAVDTGGTFTDCMARSPQGELHRAKVLSSGVLRLTDDALAALGTAFFGGHVPVRDGAGWSVDPGLEAPILAAHVVTKTPLHQALPPIEMRLATTRATNALLTRSGTPPALFLTAGFEDLLLIGDQSRPELFCIDIRRPEPLWESVVGVKERLGADGGVLKALDEKRVRTAAQALVERGVRVAAVALLHAWRNPSHEQRTAQILKEEGFSHVSVSSQLSPMQRYLPRAQTALVDAYLSPVLRDFLDRVAEKVTRLHVMTSAGGLTTRAAFSACESLLSGPAGGVVGAQAAGASAGLDGPLIAFDMGGTSTDVCLLEPSGATLVFEHGVGDVRLLSPAVGVESVAAGGGSICSLDTQGRLCVGPASAGAFPGPACYGQNGPLTLTDVNLLLGRIDEATFLVPLDRVAAERAADALATAVKTSREELLHGLSAIANETMADAIRRITVRRGIDPASATLVAFGGAGGQHACAVAEKLGVARILLPRDQSLLSAYGLQCATLTRIAERQLLAPLSDTAIESELHRLEEEARGRLLADGADAGRVVVRRRIARLRLLGQETPLDLELSQEPLDALFRRRFTSLYGYPPDPARPIEVESLRVVVEEAAGGEGGATEGGAALPGSLHSATCILPHWRADPTGDGASLLTRTAARESHDPEGPAVLELFACRFAAIAEEMGEMLRRCALSVNVKERLDYSCALLDAQGALVATAAHIPVHLGALGVCVRTLLKSGWLDGDETVVVNHPAFGGSHLPDITLITPVYGSEKTRLGFVASRAHHAELGGVRPGSTPPGATTLLEEGVVIPPMLYDRAALRDRLREGPYPSRTPDDNLADLDAQLAANRQGAAALQRLAATHGAATLAQKQRALAERCAAAVRCSLKRRAGVWSAREHLDDGTTIAVTVTIEESGTARFDFQGTSGRHPSNFNAPPAVVQAAVLYVLRLLTPADLPLNEGLLEPVDLVLPPDCLLNPTFQDDPALCPAVVAGNTEVSQRLVQALLKALKLSAGGQGTMNNVLMGNEHFGYYETVCGGAGASASAPGASGVHTHMTNTRITDPEVLESRYPVRLEKFALRRGSGGRGLHCGGDGVVREYRFLQALSLSLVTQSRGRNAPFGLNGGRPGSAGRQRLLRRDGGVETLLPVCAAEVRVGDRLRLETPGGGGWGVPSS